MTVYQDAATIATSSIGADVCVVGAGPAGLSVAAELAAAGADVVVLEAGGRGYDRHRRGNVLKVLGDHARGAQSLTRGKTTGEPYYPLRMSRSRGLGGSTNALLAHGLRARPLDPIDFGSRFGPKWPIPYDEMAQHLPAAEMYAGIRHEADPPVSWDAVPWKTAGGSTTLDVAPFSHGRRNQMVLLADQVARADSARVITNAIVTGFRTDAGSVRSVVVARRGGGAMTVKAEVFVLAAGGIDNARLLLDSQPLLDAMGPAGKHVGRSFMEHLHYVAGYLVPSSADAFFEIQTLFGDTMERWMSPADELVRKDALLRVGITAVPVHAASLDAAVPAAGELIRIVPYGPFGLRARLRQAATALRGSPQVARATAARIRGEGRSIFALPLMSEQLPDPDSRVSLGARRDRTGLRLPILNWRVHDREFVDAQRATDLLASEVERMGLGRVESLWDRGVRRPDVVTGGWHHMGTTMMSPTADDGVVDEDCRVHGIGNLYVAGSSVFPTSGYANPTLTLMALAVRLGRHLA